LVKIISEQLKRNDKTCSPQRAVACILTRGNDDGISPQSLGSGQTVSRTPVSRILTGIIGGLIEPLMIATITFVYELIFSPATSPGNADEEFAAFLQDWLESARQRWLTDVRTHPTAVIRSWRRFPASSFCADYFPI